ADDPEILLLHVHRAFEESLRLYTNDLEKAVSKRTEELQEANRMLQQEIAERKQAEKQLKQAKKQAEAANVAKSQFLANMSHELRTPMSVIIGFADLLALEELSDDQKLQTGLIQKAGKSLLRIIDDVLDISRIEAGKLEIEITECSLSKLLGGIETMMRPLAGEQGLQFEVFRAEQLPPVIRNDRDRIHQCLVNLIGNAIKFTREGHVHLKVSLDDRQGKPFVRFDVEDTGIGISADKHETVFETFTQADGSYTRRHGGTGLGLAITKQLAELLGGDISFSSRVDKGSVFSLVVPAGIDIEPQRLLDEEHADNESIRKPGTRQAPPFSGKVLVVEDHKNIRLLMEKILKRFGFEVTLAEDGQQAVEKVLEECFDLVLMDIRMPVLNGFEATERLREKGVTTPIIALTAHAMKGDREKCLEAGCDDYISKPFDQEELRRTLSKYVPEMLVTERF
ncbi:MAG: response regulator, partial [Dehalococcoidales bacterium]